MTFGNASCTVFFDDEKIIVTSTESGLLTWHVSLDPAVGDVELGRRVTEAWGLSEVGDPDAPTQEERRESWAPVRDHFAVEWSVEVPQITANSRGSKIWFVPSEWKADTRERALPDHHVALSADSGFEEIGQAVRLAMTRTLS